MVANSRKASTFWCRKVRTGGTDGIYAATQILLEASFPVGAATVKFAAASKGIGAIRYRPRDGQRLRCHATQVARSAQGGLPPCQPHRAMGSPQSRARGCQAMPLAFAGSGQHSYRSSRQCSFPPHPPVPAPFLGQRRYSSRLPQGLPFRESGTRM